MESRVRERIAFGVPAFVLTYETLRAATAIVNDPDVGWIVAAGRSMLATHAVPRTNMFSFAAPDQPWVMHEWLYGLVYALGYRALGPAFFAFVATTAMLLVGGLVIDRAFTILRHPIGAGTFASVVLLLFTVRFLTARPTGISLVFPCVLVALAQKRRFLLKDSAIAIAISLVWANAHGSFPLAFLILAATAIDAERAHRRAHLVALAGAIVASFVNPYGVRLHALVWEYATARQGTIGFLRRSLREFAPIWDARYHDVVEPAAIVGMLAIALVAADGLRRAGRRGSCALALLLCVSAVVRARDVMPAGLVGGLLVLPHLATRLGGDALPIRRRALLVAPAAIVGLAALVWVGRTRPADDWIGPGIGGDALVRLARALPDGAKVYVPFRAGGLLLMTAGERGVMTFYDSRNDCYPDTMSAVTLGRTDFQDEILALAIASGADHAIVPRAEYARTANVDVAFPYLAVLEPALRATPGFRLEAVDGGWMSFARDTVAP